MSDDDTYITLEEAQGILHATGRHIYRLAAENKIATLRTKGPRLYSRRDVERIARERGIEQERAIVVQGVSDLAQSRQMVELLKLHSEALARIEQAAREQRPADPALVERFDRLEAALAEQRAQIEAGQRRGPPRWFWTLVAVVLVVAVLVAVAAVALLALG